ncbi:MAG: hypothetical protein RIG63_03995 [Coleofasciculus chthonoplastes F3-SA18-01]|uniref:hypothetical protein n=1 Tax=Coleofasciculus chthonoplastes TaxID=64178 RepID=UPI0032F9447E
MFRFKLIRLERQSSIPRNRVSREDDNAISTFEPKKPGFLTDVLDKRAIATGQCNLRVIKASRTERSHL